MEFNAVQQSGLSHNLCSPSALANWLHRYRPSPNRQYTMGHPSPNPGMQTVYSYGSLPHEQHQHQHHQQHHHHHQQNQHQQGLQPTSRPSSSQHTWAVPHAHPMYYATPQGAALGNGENQRQFIGRPEIITSQPTSTSSVVYSNATTAPQSLATTDYFPGVIDTSKRLEKQTLTHH